MCLPPVPFSSGVSRGQDRRLGSRWDRAVLLGPQEAQAYILIGPTFSQLSGQLWIRT